ncbi:HEPN domain-containing protein [Belliella aquatica]|nr:HEPN domain-containing protein [Belliella aquatica]MCH7407577.1 HEPN domain-containing protein [Belliella aquatica]
MEIQLKNTDQDRKAQLNAFLQLLVERFQPTRIISFGKQSLQNKLKGCFASKKIVEQHFCLLICTESCTRVDYEIQEFVNNHYQNGQITIIAHGESTIKEQIEANNRFFITVLSKGKYLYSKTGYINDQSIPKFNPSKALVKAEKHFSHRISLAKGFFDCAKESLRKGNYNITAFLLHQAVEQSCITLIIVHIDYRSEFHNLNRLLGLCRSFSDEPYKLLIGEMESRRRQFDILIKSYGKARYASEFTVSQKYAEELCENVSSFIELTELMCKNRIKNFEVKPTELNLVTEKTA